jgi:hypothetical protein
MLRAFVTELRPILLLSELSGNAANRRKWLLNDVQNFLLRSSEFEPILHTSLIGRRLPSSHGEGIVFFSLLLVEYSADALHSIVLKGTKPFDPNASRN